MVPRGKSKVSHYRGTSGVSRSFQLTIMVNAPSAARAGEYKRGAIHARRSQSRTPIYGGGFLHRRGPPEKIRGKSSISGNSKCSLHQNYGDECICQVHLANYKYTANIITVIGNIRPRVRKLKARTASELYAGKNKSSQAANYQYANRRQTTTMRPLRIKIQNVDENKIWP